MCILQGTRDIGIYEILIAPITYVDLIVVGIDFFCVL